MPANFDGTSAELQPSKNTDINNKKNKENTSNENK